MKKRSRAEFERAYGVLKFEKPLVPEIKKVYPIEPPEKAKQFVDVEDHADMEYEVQKRPNIILSFKTRKKIIELRFGEYGG